MELESLWGLWLTIVLCAASGLGGAWLGALLESNRLGAKGIVAAGAKPVVLKVEEDRAVWLTLRAASGDYALVSRLRHLGRGDYDPSEWVCADSGQPLRVVHGDLLGRALQMRADGVWRLYTLGALDVPARLMEMREVTDGR